ncbi:hypothetical protein [Bacillus altitudinis]|uniref:hypothetical protein n=1 Tax=Bacillus altitudinis TaxID=293387 RepID=UPI00045CBEB7|nr:hypothetical protein [Bacillus altitudinis]MBW3701111.1 hypothetical protein [Bacillus aerophilus]KDE29901.1 hypothetical protein BA79_15937 [Bacillus altitudinis 41KF2b]MDI6649034.1 hypothetical protein [Bacillus altitudinis]MDI6663583.1 hypothetical protein [Bacillus altitudinis]MEC1043717.1 hypothetical protein [Bacillus altitudinis]
MGVKELTRNYNEAKTTIKYLEKRYGKKIYNLTIDGQKELQRLIILDHNKDDLKRMLRRIKSDIEIAKDTQSINVLPFNFFMVMIGTLGSASIGTMSFLFILINSLYNKYLETIDLSNVEVSELTNFIDFTSILRLMIIVICIPFLVILVIWGFEHKKLTSNVDKRYFIFILLEECLEFHNNISQQVEPTNRY